LYADVYAILLGRPIKVEGSDNICIRTDYNLKILSHALTQGRTSKGSETLLEPR
jgi:hypothetical protein